MAKKKRQRATGARRRTGGGAAAGWKKSKGVAIVLVAAIFGVWIWIFSYFFSSPSPTYRNFPWTYIAEGEDEKPIVIKADSDKKKRAPFKKDGKVYWDAYVCKNPDCPGAVETEDGKLKPYIFPHVIPFLKKRLEEGKPLELTPEEMKKMEQSGEMMMEMEMMHAEPKCPLCEEDGLDPFNVEPYDTPEGKKMKQELMKKYQKERAKKGGKKKKRR